MVPILFLLTTNFLLNGKDMILVLPVPNQLQEYGPLMMRQVQMLIVIKYLSGLVLILMVIQQVVLTFVLVIVLLGLTL